MECVAVALRASFHKVPITVRTVPRSCRGTDMGWWFLVSMVEVKEAAEPEAFTAFGDAQCKISVCHVHI